MLHKLQGRAQNYKDKYGRLVQMYNELVRENEKCRVSVHICFTIAKIKTFIKKNSHLLILLPVLENSLKISS